MKRIILLICAVSVSAGCERVGERLNQKINEKVEEKMEESMKRIDSVLKETGSQIDTMTNKSFKSLDSVKYKLDSVSRELKEKIEEQKKKIELNK